MTPTLVWGYPNAVVFIPAGNVRPQGSLASFLFGSLSFPYGTKAPAQGWVGANLSLLPTIEYGTSGFAFGGVETGLDLVYPFSSTPHDVPTGSAAQSSVEALVNLQIQLLAGRERAPDISCGMMALSPLHTDRTVNLGFVSVSQSVHVGPVPWGRFTAGLGASASSNPDIFQPTFPFQNGKLMPFFGWNSQWEGSFEIGIDYMGGFSDLGGTAVSASYLLTQELYFGAGVFLGNDRTTPSDGLFLVVGSTVELFASSASRKSH